MESSLAAAFEDLQADIGFFLGFGRGNTAPFSDSAWTTSQQASIDRCTKGGMRKFYFCGYDWSFLKPTASLNLPISTNTIQLPDDFGGFEGYITLFSTTSQVSWPTML